MEFPTLPSKARSKHRALRRKIHRAIYKRIETEGSSLQNLFKNSLRGMAHILKSGACSSAGHYNCTMKVVTVADNHNKLLADFLSRVLTLTHLHKTIFCTMCIDEISEKKLVAQVYGVWFDQFDTDIRSVDCQGCTVDSHENGTWKSSIGFELEID